MEKSEEIIALLKKIAAKLDRIYQNLPDPDLSNIGGLLFQILEKE